MKSEDLKKAEEAKEVKKEEKKEVKKADGIEARVSKLEKQFSDLKKTVSTQSEILDKALASLENIEKAVCCQSQPQQKEQPKEPEKPQQKEPSEEDEPVEAKKQPKQYELDMVTYNYIFSYTTATGQKKFTKSSLKAHKRVNGFGYNYHEAIFYPNGSYVLLENIEDPVLKTMYEDEFDRRVEI